MAIDAIHKGEVQIGSALIPISDNYKKAFRDLVEKNQMQQGLDHAYEM